MILEEVSSSTSDPSTERSFNLLLRDNSGYIYATSYLGTTWFYNSALQYITEDAFVQTDFQLCPSTGYFAQTRGTDNRIRIGRFDGTTSYNIVEQGLPGASRGCAITSSYAYFYRDYDGFQVYNYSGTLVNTVSSPFRPRNMYTFDNDTKLISIAGNGGIGAYIVIYLLSGNSMTLIDSYEINSSTAGYVNTDVGVPYIRYPNSQLILLGVNTTNPLKEFYFDGWSDITLRGEYPFYPGALLALQSDSGDTIFGIRSNDYSGVGPYGLLHLDRFTYQVQSYENLSNAPGTLAYGDGYCLVSKWSTGSRIKLYRVLPAPNHEHFQAIWR